MSKLVVMTEKDFTNFVDKVTSKARIDELERIRPRGNGSYIKRRISGIKNGIIDPVFGNNLKKKTTKPNHYFGVKITEREDIKGEFEDQEQFIVREK